MISYSLIFTIFFLMGSIPTAYLAGKVLQGKDLRKFGSGNIGATNAFRVLGMNAGFFVFAVDFFKGFLPILITKPLFLGHENLVWLTAGPILGHIFTPFLGFKGGKGVATGAGVLLALGPDLFAFSLGVWLLIFFIFRMVSVGSLVSSTLLPLWAWIRGYPIHEIFFISVLSVLLICTHRANIRRLLRGQEGRSDKLS